VRDAGRGRLGSLSADDCLTADRKQTVAKARQKTDVAEASSCTSAPAFGPADATTVNQAAVSGAMALVHDVLGADLDATVISQETDRAGARCQQAVSLSLTKCLAERAKELGRCTQSALKAGAGSAADLLPCIGADPGGRIARRCDGRMAKDVATRCAAHGVALSVAFPPCTSDDAQAVAGCLSEAARARACAIIDGAATLGASCP
jgi:hypothetical protein